MLEVLSDMWGKPRARPGKGAVAGSIDVGVAGWIDGAIAQLAGRQHGVVARRQLIALGLSSGSIDHRLATGRLHLVYRGVYAVGHPRLTVRGKWMAAVLTCGEDTILSHRSAGAHWGIAPYAGRWIDVTAPGTRRSRRTGLIIHGGRLEEEERMMRDGIPVTSVARTLLDLAEVVDRRRLVRAFERADRLELLDLRAVERVCQRSRGRHGLGSLLGLLPNLKPPPHTRSELERRFLDLCRDFGLPAPIVNATVAGFEVDALWPHAKLIVELDGYEFHRTRAAFERDRARDAVLQARGHRVVRLTQRRLTNEPAATAGLIRRLLAG